MNSVDYIARRQIPRYDGLYVDGMVQGGEVTFTVDTGASTSIISPSVYEQIAQRRKPPLEPMRKPIANADGNIISCQATFEIRIGSVCLEQKIVVADIEDEALLGMDFLLTGFKQPADILLSEKKMIVDGKEIPLIQVHTPRKLRRVRAADHFVVEGLSEKVVDAFLDQGSKETDSLLLVENNGDLCTNYGLLLAASLVDGRNNATVKVRLMNPSSKAVSIKQDMVLGNVTEVQSILGSLPIEGTSKNPIRQVQEPNNQIDLPEHLVPILTHSAESLSPLQKEALKMTLIEFRNTFSKDEIDPLN